VPAVAAILTVGLLLACILTRSSVVVGDFGAQQAANVLVVVVLVTGGVALGVLLARVLPWTLVPIVTLVALGFGSARLASTGTASNPIRQLSTWLGESSQLDVRFTAPHWLAHVLWLVALTAVVAVLAILRDDRRPVVVVGLVLAVGAAALSGWAATRPIARADAARIAAMLADPQAAQDCDVVGPVTVCTFEPERELRERYLEEVAPVVAVVPADFAPVVFRWGVDVDRRHLDPEVSALLPSPVSEPGLVPFDLTAVDDAYDGARAWVGLGAVGVLDAYREGVTIDLLGEARGVIALWLATRGADADSVHGLTDFERDPAPGEAEHRPWPDPCYAGEAPVRWSEGDVLAARALTELPEPEVAAVLAEGWDRYLDPATTTEELLDAFGLEPAGDQRRATRAIEC
jgi:hypothetical protein